MKAIPIMGIVCLFFIAILYLGTIQLNPSLGQLESLSSQIQMIFNLQRVFIQKIFTPQGFQYRIQCHCKILPSDKVIQNIGVHFWENYKSIEKSTRVFVIIKCDSGGCSSNPLILEKEVFKPMTGKFSLKKIKDKP
jgi:hypothetical protein